MDIQADALCMYLLSSLTASRPHLPLETVVEGLPWDRTGEDVPGFPHTAFSLVWHMGACMRHVIRRTESELRRQPVYPTEFWPAHAAPLARSEWVIVVDDALRCETTLLDWARSADLMAPHAPSAPIAADGPASVPLLVELILTARHNAFHIGQLVDYRSLIGLPVAK